MRLTDSLFFAVLLTAALACGDDSVGPDTGTGSDTGTVIDTGTGSDTGTGGDTATGGDTGGDDLCQRGCVATLAAACTNGPATQGQCETDCEGLRTSDCSAEYEALLACADGEDISCDPSGQPVIAACDTEQGLFIACIS